MTNSRAHAEAGLIFLQNRDFDIVELVNQLTSGIQATGHHAAEIHIHSDARARILTGRFYLELELIEDVPCNGLDRPAPLVLQLRAANRSGRLHLPACMARDLLLAHGLDHLHRQLTPSFITWIDSDVLMPGKAFVAAMSYQRARHTKTARALSHARHTPFSGFAAISGAARNVFPDVEETCAILQTRLTDRQPAIAEHPVAPIAAPPQISPAEQRLRRSAWVLSIAMAVVSLPVGAALLAISALHGTQLLQIS